MKIIKRILISLVVLFGVLVGGFYLYIQTLPTSAPQSVSAADLDKKQKALNFTCNTQGEFNYAYQVDITIESVINNQQVYRSDLAFKTQLNQANGPVIKGIATQISINEGQGSKSIEDIYYLSKVEGKQYASFSAFNNLGLAKQHPMAMLSQLLKAISVGEEGESYLFTYDPLQRTYRYRQQNNKVERASYTSTATLQQLSNLFTDYKNQWSVTLGQDCVPESATSVERQSIAAGNHGGYIKFTVNAKKIPLYTTILDGQHNDLANINQSWKVKEIGQNEFENDVTSPEQMWDIFNEFKDNKKTSQLIKAAEYMLENVSSASLASSILDPALADTSIRDLIFGLGISGSDEAENYLINVLNDLPVGAGDQVDINKVRLMVAISGNGKITESGFASLESVLNNPAESNNVKSNALINMGSVVTQLDNNEQNTQQLKESLTNTVKKQINTGNSAAAILAAGNAKLDTLDDAYLTKLTSGSAKERYAAGTVLGRDEQHYDALINHVAGEESNLVVNAIVNSLNAKSLSAEQAEKIQKIANQNTGDKGNILRSLLNRR
jgi:hypothetical protein